VSGKATITAPCGKGLWIGSALADMANEGVRERLLDEGLDLLPAKVKPIDGL
jgi:hypothetical protein